MTIVSAMVAVLVGVGAATGAQRGSCTDAARAALIEAARLATIEHLDHPEQALAAAYKRAPRCVDVARAYLALAGWNTARAAAGFGGSPEMLVPPRRFLRELDALAARGQQRIEIDYARSLLAAAIAAAQDERDEMRLHLVHARSLHDRLLPAQQAALWPLPIDEAEGELFLEVDLYADAIAAYRRAAASGRHRALFSLARAATIAGDAPLACEAYRRWLASAPADARDRDRATKFVASCKN